MLLSGTLEHLFVSPPGLLPSLGLSRGPPWEPLVSASLADLALKAVFLVTLASGRRCSEVHALSSLDSDVSYEADGSVLFVFFLSILLRTRGRGTLPLLFVSALFLIWVTGLCLMPLSALSGLFGFI